MSRDRQPDWLLEYRQAVGDRIRAHRIHANRTQWWVCEVTGLGRSTYQEIERGETDARLSWLARIAHALDTTVADLTATQAPRAPE